MHTPDRPRHGTQTSGRRVGGSRRRAGGHDVERTSSSPRSSVCPSSCSRVAALSARLLRLDPSSARRVRRGRIQRRTSSRRSSRAAPSSATPSSTTRRSRSGSRGRRAPRRPSACRTRSPRQEVTGFDVETTKLVAKGLGVEACFTQPTWTEVTSGNWSDRLDIATAPARSTRPGWNTCG